MSRQCICRWKKRLSIHQNSVTTIPECVPPPELRKSSDLFLPNWQLDLSHAAGEQLRGTVKKIASSALQESSVLFVVFLSAESLYGSCCAERSWVCRFRVRPKSPHPRIRQSQEKCPARPGRLRISTVTPTG